MCTKSEGRGDTLFSCVQHLGRTQPPIRRVPGGSSPEWNRSVREIDYVLPSSAEVKDEQG